MTTTPYQLFNEWLEKFYPETKLLPWQAEFAELFLNGDVEGLVAARASGSGKTFLANIIREFQDRSDLMELLGPRLLDPELYPPSLNSHEFPGLEDLIPSRSRYNDADCTPQRLTLPPMVVDHVEETEDGFIVSGHFEEPDDDDS